MVDQTAAKYLSDNIGDVLSRALGEMIIAQPRDGVEFLSDWLQMHVEQENAKAKQEEQEAQFAKLRANAQEHLAASAAKAEAEKKSADDREALYKNFMDTLQDPNTIFDNAFWQELFAVVQSVTNAKSVYLGQIEDEGLDDVEGPLIRYTQIFPGSELMLEKTLRQGQGVTWGAVTENPSEEVLHLWKPPLPPPPEANPENPDEPPPESQLPPYLPVSVPCVTDVQEMHYFDVTRLGAYFAVPLIYQSYHNMESYAAAKTFEEEKLAAAKKLQEAVDAHEAAVAEAKNSGGDEVAEAVEKPPEMLEAVEQKEMVLPGKVIKMVLCMDTLGTNKAIDESCFEMVREMAIAFGKCKEKTENKQVDQQALQDLDEERRQKVIEDIAAAKATIEEDASESQQIDDAEIAADDDVAKDLSAKKWAYVKSVRVLLELPELIFDFQTWVAAPSDVVNLLAAVALFFGYMPEQIYPKRKSTFRWEEIRDLLDRRLLNVIHEADVTAERKGLVPMQRLAAIKAMRSPEFDAEKINELAPNLTLLSDVFEKAIEYRTAHLLSRKAAFERQKEEEGEEFALPPLEEADDDFEELGSGSGSG